MKFLTLTLAMFLSTSTIVHACKPPAEGFLLWDCKGASAISIHVQPKGRATITKSRVKPLLAVTGAYTSADRHGVEGLFIVNGQLLGARVKSWDGILVVEAGNARIFNRRNVQLGGQHFDLRNLKQRNKFISLAQSRNASVLQSHLLITDTRLDVRQRKNRPRFKRRLLVQTQTGIGVYETQSPTTLYEAGKQMADSFAPDMALNLDMGAFDFCQKQNAQPCGRLFVPIERLTNFLVFKKRNKSREGIFLKN